MNTVRRNISPLLAYHLRYQNRFSIKNDCLTKELRNDPRCCYVISQLHTGRLHQDTVNPSFESLRRKIIYGSTLRQKLEEVYLEGATANKEVHGIRRDSEYKGAHTLT